MIARLSPVILLLAACEPVPTQETASSGLKVHESYVCSAKTRVARGGNPVIPKTSAVTSFTMKRLSLPGEPNRFQIATGSGVTVGVGRKRENGDWVISNWQSKKGGPKVSLVSFYTDKQVLVSVKTDKKSHVTYAGGCRNA